MMFGYGIYRRQQNEMSETHTRSGVARPIFTSFLMFLLERVDIPLIEPAIEDGFGNDGDKDYIISL